MRSRWRRRYLMPGRWAHRRFCVTWTRRLSGLALIFGLLAYGLALSSLLTGS